MNTPMTLGLSTDTDTKDFPPYVKYDARSGRMYKVDREFANGSWSSYTTELDQPTFAVDLHNVQKGQISYDPHPNFVMVPVDAPLPPRPTDKHKPGFRVQVYNKQLGLRDFSNCAKCVIAGMDKLYAQFRAANQPVDKLPVVHLVRTELREKKTPLGTTRNYEPVFEITGWIDRPVDWPARETPKAPSAPSASVVPNSVQIPAYHFPEVAGPTTAGTDENLF